MLRSVEPVIGSSEHVRTNPDAVEVIADWMAYEPFAPPEGGPAGPFDWGDDPDVLIDAVMLKACLDFAFTGFDTGERFEVDYLGRRWSDSEAMYACLHRAWTAGTPILDGDYQASVDADELSRVFEGPVAMPMVPERVVILNDVGAVLAAIYGGRFHRFIRDCAPAVYADGDGLLDRLIVEFPRFDDTSTHDGAPVSFHKLGQLAIWSLHLTAGEQGDVVVRDLASLSAFADYVVPVGLRLMRILEYTDELETAITSGELIARDSDEEIEIRAHSIYASALLTEAINRRRPDDRQLIIPNIDFRLWSTYHTTHWPHHLTRTVMY